MAESPSSPEDIAAALEDLARKLRQAQSPPRRLTVGGPETESLSEPEADPDIVNDGLALTVTLEAPGVDARRLRVSLADGRLCIDFGDRAREVALPERVDPEGAMATLRNGVLDIVLPLAHRAGPA